MEHIEIKPEISKRKGGKSSLTWKFNNTALKYPWVKEEVLDKIRKYFS